VTAAALAWPVAFVLQWPEGEAEEEDQAMAARKKNLVVTVDDAHMPNIHQVAEQLKSRGMKVEEVLEATGMITGSSRKGMSGLRAVPGVVGVEEQPQIQLPPPDSPVQ
jgi:hypothetical protein